MDSILQYLGGLSFEGGLSVFISSLVTAVVAGIVKGWRESKKKDAAVQRAYESTRPTGGKRVDELEPPATPLLTEADYVRNLRTQLDESERLHAAEARNLRRQVREMQDSIDELKADLIVATNERLKAERHGAEIVRQWRASNELKSNAPPPDPRTPGVQGATTVPPKAR